MDTKMRGVLLCIALAALCSNALSAQERWVYLYDGPANGRDEAYSVIMGSDGNLYVAGMSWGTGTHLDFTVVSLTPTGEERWVYRYDGPANYEDMAQSIVMGLDGNLYVAGRSYGSGTSIDFLVVSLTDSGSERWVYRYNGLADWSDVALSVVMGPDSNLYVAGYSTDSAPQSDITVVSLTTSGSERWVYKYNGPGDYYDAASSIIAGPDGTLYVAGESRGVGTFDDFTVVSLTDLGEERWVYRYTGPGNFLDDARSIVVGWDGNLYAAGRVWWNGSQADFTVVSLTDSGTERWVYHYNGPGNNRERAYSIAAGSDSVIYAAGSSHGGATGLDFAVVSLTDSGTERWVYLYNGPGNHDDEAYSIIVGLDGNLYVGGESRGAGSSDDFTVVSLTSSGSERWVYRYNGSRNDQDQAYSIVMGSDGNLYAAGRSWESVSYYDFALVSLDPDVGVEEQVNRPSLPDFRLWQNSPNPLCHSTMISYSLRQTSRVTLEVFDASGRRVETLINGTQQSGVHHVPWLSKDEPGGVYFCRLNAGESRETRKMVVVE